MALAYTPLDPSALSPAAQQALAPGPMKMMAARGMAPLSDPRDLLSVLYQLSLDADTTIKTAATQSAGALPQAVLQGGLSDGHTDPRVLDFFAHKVKSDSTLIELIVLNPATAGETLANLARTAERDLVDLMAQNEERLLRNPAIIAAMYHNRNARMSTVDRLIELAVRTDVKVDGIPAWDELRKLVLGQKTVLAGDAKFGGEGGDTLFAEAARKMAEGNDQPSKSDEEKIPLEKMPVAMKIRMAVLGNKFVRATLIRDRVGMVALAAIKASGITESEVAKYASNSALSDEVITYIAGKREWTKLYSVKLALIMNPKTPIPQAMRFMSFMREKDLRAISRSKGIPSAVAAQAKKLVNQRTTRGKR